MAGLSGRSESGSRGAIWRTTICRTTPYVKLGPARAGILPRKMARASPGKLCGRYTVRDGRRFRLADVDPRDDGGLERKKDATSAILQEGIDRLRDLQEKLYAQDRWGLLLIFQAMDAAGKDGAIAHVMSGVNPQGCDVSSFKSPSSEELDHDYLWRTHKCIPARGKIGIFNRSYYEEVLVVRVHPTFLRAQKLPGDLITKHIWDERYEDINSFQRYLTRNSVVS